MTPSQAEFLQKAHAAASSADHIFPEIAACEAALESGWGQSKLAIVANNLFGQKQSHPPVPGTETLSLPTREYLHGDWVTVSAEWIKFPSWNECFRSRMALLRRLSRAYPHYAKALESQTEEQFATEVSKSWSTDPDRAQKVLNLWRNHFLQSQAAHALTTR